MKVNSWLAVYFDKLAPLRGAVLLSIVSMYFTNRSQEWSSVDIISDTLLAILMLVLLLWSLGVNRVARKFLIIYFAIIISSIISFSFGGIFNIHWLYFIICLEVVRLNVLFTGRNLQVLCILGFFAILIQVLIFRSDDGRPVLSIGDPNYSAYYVFIFLLFAHASKQYTIAIVLFVIIFLSLSRTAFVAVMLFFTFIFIHKYFNYCPRVNKWLYFGLLLFGPISYSLLFLSSGIDIDSTYTSDAGRLASFADQSNMDRSLANVNFFDYIYENPFSLISGIDVDYYTNEIFRNTPHASVYALVFNYGVFYVISIFAALILLIRSARTRFSISILGASLLPWMIFLGGVLFGPQVIFLGLVFNSFKSRYD